MADGKDSKEKPKYKLIGQNYQLNDLVAKVTGRSKYAEDFRAEGMLHCRLLLSPLPHARIRKIDATAALAMPGVVAILTGDDVPKPAVGGAGGGRGRDGRGDNTPQPNTIAEVALASEPLYQGEPIVAVAAIDELTAAEAIEKIKVDYEPLPFVVDPIESLKPNGPNARLEGNVWKVPQVATMKYPESAMAELDAGRLPVLDDAPVKWQVGDVDAAFKDAALVLDETLVHQSNSHAPLEPRTAMAYWQNGKLYLHGSTQSVAQTVRNVAGWVDVPPEQVVVISEYTGGGFGGKIPGAQTMAIPALLSKKTGRPVQMRISREEEHYIGRGRTGVHMRVKMGFRKDGRMVALDIFTIGDCGPYANQGDFQTVASTATALYTPINVRFRGVGVLTNTPPRVSQRAPGGEQASTMLEPILSKAARKLGIDQVEIRKINAPVTGSEFGAPLPTPQGQAPGRVVRNKFTSAYLKEALDRGAELFNWNERSKRNGQRNGSKVTGVAVGLGTFTAGSLGFDGLLTIRPDGRLYVQQGVGNLGTGSVMDTARVAAEVLGMPWEKTEVIWGDTSKNLPWSSPQAGSQTAHAHSRSNHAAAMDAVKKLQEIAAKDLGGKPEDYEVSNERVHRKGSAGGGLTFAQAATRAIALGGKYDGHELPKDINEMTKASAANLAGQGLMGVAKDNYGRTGSTQSFVAGFSEVEVDLETGTYNFIEYVAVADCGVVLNPRGLGAQIHGGGVQGVGQVRSQNYVYDQRYGVSLANRFHYNKPPTILDIPVEMKWDAVGIPDPQTPIGAKGIGEPAIAAGSAAAICAVTAAIGDDLVRRTPATPGNIVASIDAGRRIDAGLKTHV